jgi:hypothetical protein
MGSYLIGQGHRGYQTSGYRRPKDANEWWWTQQRDEKLRYVMENYNDIAKAARVLGIGIRSARWRWNSLLRRAASGTEAGTAETEGLSPKGSARRATARPRRGTPQP